MKLGCVVGALILGCVCSSCGRVATDSVTVNTSIPYLAADTPMSVGSIRNGDTITVAFIDVFGGSSSCDVLGSVSIDDVAFATEIDVTFPAGVHAGQHALSEIGAVATYRTNDGACAPAHAGTATSGTLSFSDTDELSSVQLVFGVGTFFAGNVAAPHCATSAPSDASACAVLGPCKDSGNASCFQM